jgi:16S rRNA processing protein RimM
MGLLHAGRVGRPHGLDGSFHVTRPRPVLLVAGAAVRVGATVRSIVRRAGTAERPIVRLDGVDDRAAAEALRGEDLLVARADAPSLPPGEFWAEDLEGCLVVTPGGRELGRVERLLPLPSCEALEIGELLVPMVADAVLDVRLDARRIVVDPEFLGVAAAEGGAAVAPREDAGAAQRVDAGTGQQLKAGTAGQADAGAGEPAQADAAERARTESGRDRA